MKASSEVGFNWQDGSGAGFSDRKGAFRWRGSFGSGFGAAGTVSGAVALGPLFAQELKFGLFNLQKTVQGLDTRAEVLPRELEFRVRRHWQRGRRAFASAGNGQAEATLTDGKRTFPFEEACPAVFQDPQVAGSRVRILPKTQ